MLFARYLMSYHLPSDDLAKLEALRKDLQPSIERLDRGEGTMIKESEIRSYLEGLYHEAITDLDNNQQARHE